MKKGFDSDRDMTKFASCLKSKYDFVCRYYNANTPAKNLSLSEATVLMSVGLRIVPIWENGFPTSSGYFSRSKGVFDGTSAYHYAEHVIGQNGGVIYFAVDYDATNAEVSRVIVPYFQGIQQAFDTYSQGNPRYMIGVYGSGLVCLSVFKANLARYTWVAQSKGWAGSATFGTPNIKQLLQVNECVEIQHGITGDPNHCLNDDEGSFSSFLNSMIA